MEPVTPAFSMPPVGGAYPPPPYLYHRGEELVAAFETDEAVARALVPPALEIRRPARGVVRFVRHEASPFGPYSGAYVGVQARWRDRDVVYMLFGLKSDFAGTAAGREIWGMPLKVGDVRLRWRGDQLVATARRAPEAVLCRLTAELLAAVPAAGPPRAIPAVFLKRIPPAEAAGAPADALVLVGTSPGTEGEPPRGVWEARVHLELRTGGPSDPWGLLPVGATRGARYLRGGTIELGYGEVVAPGS